MVVRGHHGGGGDLREQRVVIAHMVVALIEVAQQIPCEKPLVAGHRGDLGLAERGYLAGQLVARHGDRGLRRVHLHDLLDAAAHRVERVLVRGGGIEDGLGPDEGVVVVREDGLLLGPEVAEEGAAGDPGRPRDLVDRRRLVPLRGEQLHRRRGQFAAHLEPLGGGPGAAWAVSGASVAAEERGDLAGWDMR